MRSETRYRTCGQDAVRLASPGYPWRVREQYRVELCAMADRRTRLWTLGWAWI